MTNPKSDKQLSQAMKNTRRPGLAPSVPLSQLDGVSLGLHVETRQKNCGKLSQLLSHMLNSYAREHMCVTVTMSPPSIANSSGCNGQKKNARSKRRWFVQAQQSVIVKLWQFPDIQGQSSEFICLCCQLFVCTLLLKDKFKIFSLYPNTALAYPWLHWKICWCSDCSSCPYIR